MIKVVAIDIDDTFSLTEAVCFDMENEVLKILGRPPMSRAIHLSTWGKPLHIAIIERSPGVDTKAFDEIFPKVKSRYVTSGKLDDIPHENYVALDQLSGLGKDIVVLTSRTHTEIHHLLEPDHLLAQRVKAFYYRDNMQFHKPDPRAFNELLQDNSILPEQCVYVGDSISDAHTANEAGLHFIASLESGLRTKRDFNDLPVDVFIEKFPDIVSAVNTVDSLDR